MSKLERDIHEPFEDSKFADDDGNLFSVKSVYEFVESNPKKYLHKNFPLNKIEHNLEWWDSSYDIDKPNDKNRVLNADLSYPLLVIKEKDGNLSVSDGLNRLYKAINLKHLTHLPVYLVKKSEIEHLAINKNDVGEDKQFSPPPHETETYDKIMGTKHNKHNPYDEDDDKDDVFPIGSGDWRKKKETKEQWDHDEEPISTDIDLEDGDDDDDRKPKRKKDIKETGADSSGAFEGPAFGKTILKRDIYKLKNLPNAKKYDVNEKEKIQEQMTADVSAGAMFDVPAFGKTTKGGRKNPLAIDGPKSIAKSRAVTDPNFPKWGGPGGVFIKIKEKCKKFPYCNQGDINAIEPLREAITKAAEKYGVPRQDVEKIVINEINKIFILHGR